MTMWMPDLRERPGPPLIAIEMAWPKTRAGAPAPGHGLPPMRLADRLGVTVERSPRLRRGQAPRSCRARWGGGPSCERRPCLPPFRGILARPDTALAT